LVKKRLSQKANCVEPLDRFALFGIKHSHRPGWHNCRNCVLINQLHLPVTAQQNAKTVKGRDNASEFNTIDQKYCEGNTVFADGVEENILQIMCAFSHFYRALIFLGFLRVPRTILIRASSIAGNGKRFNGAFCQNSEREASKLSINPLRKIPHIQLLLTTSFL
jgi:hypothetical protein